MKPKKSGLSRMIHATRYSAQGILHAWKNETAFRQELIASAIMLPLAFVIGNSAVEIAVLILCLFITLMVEIINSAIEAVVDLVSPEIHPLAKAAKDCGSAAVFFALISTVLIWALIIIQNYL